MSSELLTAGRITHDEIFQQPDLWPDTLLRVMQMNRRLLPTGERCVITGAGSSAYAAMAVAAAWPSSQAVPSTDLLSDVEPDFGSGGFLISLARSGDSPESLGVVNRIKRLFPHVRHLAITCNAEGRLARVPGLTPVILDPRTNDRSLAMTSSFSNLVLAGLALRHSSELTEVLPKLCARVKENLVALDAKARAVASGHVGRVVVLASSPLMGWALEASLKILEMTAGRIPVVAETHLGLRHGPMSFVHPDTVVLSLASSNPLSRRYEQDLLDELHAKKLGRIIRISSGDGQPFGDTVPAMAPELPDMLRTPFEIVFPQLLAFQLSLRENLNPDNPSPGGVINRVVQGVRIYED
ncbi:MAG: tagatose-6-phosphate ketose isomerase [Acidobacteriia bacterium]|nr:tagatose-6-phosphate ketose isomerase [Terriglobia bacterium]